MSCINRKCKIKTNLRPNGLCQDCDKFISDWNKRKDNSERMRNDRAEVMDQNRDISVSPPAPDPNQIDFPDLELTRMVRQWKDMSSGTVQAPDPNVLLQDMYGMIAVTAQQMQQLIPDISSVKDKVKSNSARIEALEAKVGDSSQLATSRSLAVRNLPLPSGMSELEQAQLLILEVGAPGVVPNRDVTRAERRGAAPATATAEARLGTVIIELASEDICGKVMKKKKDLLNHPDPRMKNIIISNALSRHEMATKRSLNELLKRIPGSENSYFGGNGVIRSRDTPPPHTTFTRQPFQRPHQPPLGNIRLSRQMFQSNTRPQSHPTMQFPRPPPGPPLAMTSAPTTAFPTPLPSTRLPSTAPPPLLPQGGASVPVNNTPLFLQTLQYRQPIPAPREAPLTNTQILATTPSQLSTPSLIDQPATHLPLSLPVPPSFLLPAGLGGQPQVTEVPDLVASPTEITAFFDARETDDHQPLFSSTNEVINGQNNEVTTESPQSQ